MCPRRRVDGRPVRRAAGRGVAHFTRARECGDGVACARRAAIARRVSQFTRGPSRAADLTPAYRCAARRPVAYVRRDFAFRTRSR